jgi:hypothetical protein
MSVPGFAGRAVDLLRAQAVVKLFVVGQAVESQPLDEVFLFSGETRAPAWFGVAVLVAQPTANFAFGQQGFQRFSGR